MKRPELRATLPSLLWLLLFVAVPSLLIFAIAFKPATSNGAEYLTYVLWAITPEGRTSNLGEVLLNGTKSKLNVTTELQVFGLVVTAEPYFAVTRPSDLIVMENVVRPDTSGKVEEIDAEVKWLMGEAEIAHIGQGQRITWKQQNRSGFYVAPKSFRVLNYPQERKAK